MPDDLAGVDGIGRLGGLARIGIEDAGTFSAAADAAEARSGRQFFPMLFFNGTSRSRQLYWEREGDSLLVYLLRRRNAEWRLNLYLPPMPFAPAALRHGLGRIGEFNGDRRGGIVWIAERDALAVAREGLRVEYKDEEYIFDRGAVMALEGSGFRSLRQELSRAAKAGHVEVRAFRPEDRSACESLVADWRRRLVDGGIRVGGYGCTMACLAGADSFAYPLMHGLVVEIDGTVRGFAFSGKLAGSAGCNFLCITDPGFRGLPHLLRYRIMADFPQMTLFNDSTDSGRPGLRELKQRFRPVAMHQIFGAGET